MKKHLLILALPFVMATAFAQNTPPADCKEVKPAAGTKTRAEVKAEVVKDGALSTKNNEVVRPGASASAMTPAADKRTRADVKSETAAAERSGELNKVNQLVSPADTMTAEQKSAQRRRAMRAKKAKENRTAKAAEENMEQSKPGNPTTK